jgi:hypothetical protein
VLVTDGRYTESKECIGVFLALEAADLDEALAWETNVVAAGCRLRCGIFRSSRTEGSSEIVCPRDFGTDGTFPILRRMEVGDGPLSPVFPK